MPESWLRASAALFFAMLLVACAPTASNSGAEPQSSRTPAGMARTFEVDVNGHVLRGGCRGAREPDQPAVILLSGLGSPGSQLSIIEHGLRDAALVCTYDRAGVGNSDPATGPSTFEDAVEDFAAVLAGADIAPPYIIVGQSVGGTIALRYAQLHPQNVSGFVAMTPGPPATAYEARAAAVETPDELQTVEIDFNNGANEEGMNFRSTDLILDEPFPATVPYVVMYAENCEGDFCDRIRPVLAAAMGELAHLGDGRFVAVEGAGHEIFQTNLDDVLAEVRSLLPAA
ncbi:alpha/beta fold hydrolase [Microbacterium pumilum]